MADRLRAEGFPASDIQVLGAADHKMNVVVRRGPDGTMQVARRPIAEMRKDLREIVEEMK